MGMAFRGVQAPMGGMSTLSVQSIENPKLVEINFMTHLSEINAKKPVGMTRQRAYLTWVDFGDF